MYLNTTTLREITEFSSKSEEKAKLIAELTSEDRHLLLLHSSGTEIVVFNPPSVPGASRPRIDVFHIRLSSDDFYRDRTPLFR
jgi:hypothetical protein